MDGGTSEITLGHQGAADPSPPTTPLGKCLETQKVCGPSSASVPQVGPKTVHPELLTGSWEQFKELRTLCYSGNHFLSHAHRWG